MWKVTEMLDFWLSPSHPYDTKKLSVNQQAVYVSLYTVGMQNNLWLLDDLFCFEEYSKSRLFKRAGSIYEYFHNTYMLNKRNRSLLSEVFNLLLNMPEKQFTKNCYSVMNSYYELTKAELVVHDYYIYKNFEVIDKRKSDWLYRCSRFNFLSKESYESEFDNFMHIYLLYKDAEYVIDDFVLEQFPIVKALINTLGEEEALEFLNKQTKFVSGIPF